MERLILGQGPAEGLFIGSWQGKILKRWTGTEWLSVDASVNKNREKERRNHEKAVLCPAGCCLFAAWPRHLGRKQAVDLRVEQVLPETNDLKEWRSIRQRNPGVYA